MTEPSAQATEWDFPNAATPEGSAAYYVVRFSEPAEQHRLAHWFAWFGLLDQIAQKPKDPGVARLKLDWWRDEVQRLIAQQARHPLCQLLQASITDSAQISHMHRLIEVAERRILRHQPADLQELISHCSDDQTSRLQLLCNPSETAQVELLQDLGQRIGLTERLLRLRSDARDHYLNLPQNLLNQYGISTQTLSDAADQTQLPADVVELNKHLLKQAELSPELLARLRLHSRLHPAARLGAQMRHRQKQLRRTSALPPSATATPLTLLWRAWRMR